MSFLNMPAEGEGSPKKFKKYRAFIGIGVIAAAIGLSSTLAANININAGPVEFGQGVAQTVACSGDESIIVTPATSFSNRDADVVTSITDGDGTWIEVSDRTGITIGMIVSNTDGLVPAGTVVTGFDGPQDVYLSQQIGAFGSEQSVTFSPSSGTEQTTSSTGAIYNDSEFNIGTSSLEASTSGIEIGMFVSGPGISPNTVVVYVSSGEGQYLEFSKDIDYTSGELAFTNSGKSSFELSDITISGIPETCNGKVFTIKLYDNESSEPLAITDWGNDPDNSFQVYWGNGLYTEGEGSLADNYAMLHFERDQWFTDDRNYDGDCIPSGGCLETAHSIESSMASDAFRVILPLTIDARRVYKITVESQDDSDTFEYFNGGITTSSFNEFFWRHID